MPYSCTPVKVRKISSDLNSPKQDEQMLDLGHYSSFQSPVKKFPAGKPPLSRIINSSPDIEGLSSIEIKLESPSKNMIRSMKFRQLSAEYMLSKAKFMQKVVNESKKLGFASN